MKNILVISPHPDDDVSACGRTLRKHIFEGDTVDVVFLTSCEQGGHGKSQTETKKIRELEAKTASDILENSKIDFWREPDGEFQAKDICLASSNSNIDPAAKYYLCSA